MYPVNKTQKFKTFRPSSTRKLQNAQNRWPSWFPRMKIFWQVIRFPSFSFSKPVDPVFLRFLKWLRVNIDCHTCRRISRRISSCALSWIGGSLSIDSSLTDLPPVKDIIGICPGRTSGTLVGSYPSHTRSVNLSPMDLSARTASRWVAPRRLVPLTCAKRKV